MNKKQYYVLWVVGLLLVLVLMFPPWKVAITLQGHSVAYPIGYHFLFTLPHRRHNIPNLGLSIDIVRLAVEILLVIVVGGSAFLTAGRKDTY